MSPIKAGAGKKYELIPLAVTGRDGKKKGWRRGRINERSQEESTCMRGCDVCMYSNLVDRGGGGRREEDGEDAFAAGKEGEEIRYV